MLDAQALDLHYGAAQALRAVSLKAEPGKVTCVLGRNGVGKTSLLDALAGQHPVSHGHIMWEGNDITGLRPAERARRGIAYVPQGREIFPLLTVEENLKTGFAPIKRDQRTIPDDVYSLFPVLQSMLRRRGGDLSGGRHPAVDHQGYRPRHQLSAVARQDRHHPGRAISGLRQGTRRPFRRHGSRRHHLYFRSRQSRRGGAEASHGYLTWLSNPSVI
jgi:ABC-type hemin transport system ATPase subunit